MHLRIVHFVAACECENAIKVPATPLHSLHTKVTVLMKTSHLDMCNVTIEPPHAIYDSVVTLTLLCSLLLVSVIVTIAMLRCMPCG